MIFRKEPTTVQNFTLSTAQVKFYQICTLIGYFCWKYIMFQLKKVWRKYVLWYQRVVQNLKKNLFFVSKMTRIWWILIRALKSLTNFHFDWSFLCKVYNVWPEKVQRSYISWHSRVMQNLKEKNDLWFRKWHDEFGKFSSEHLKVSKLVFSWHHFVQSKKCMSYKLTEGLQVMALKNGEKSEEELTCCFKIDMRIWQILTYELKSLKNLLFNGLLLTKVYNVSGKKSTKELYLIPLKIDAKVEGKLGCASKNWHEKFGKFSSEHLKVSSKLGPWWHPFV